MSDPRILLCGPVIDAAESAARLEMLRPLSLPNSTKFVVTTGKFDAGKQARTFNVEAEYPAEPAYLQTLSRWAETADGPDPRFRDGYDLFCLGRIMARNPDFEIAVLLRDATAFEDHWPELLAGIEGKLFLTFVGGSSGQTDSSAAPNVLFDLSAEQAGLFLDSVCELYLTGTSYAIEPYDLDQALRLAFEALGHRSELMRSLGSGGSLHRGSPAGITDSARADLADPPPETEPIVSAWQ